MANPTNKDKTADKAPAVTETTDATAPATSTESSTTPPPPPAQTKSDKVFNALTSMNDDDPVQWTPEGMPSLAYLTEVVGEVVTEEDILAVASADDVKRKAPPLNSPEDSDEDAPDKQNTISSKPKRREPMKLSSITPEMVAADAKRKTVLEDEIAYISAQIQAATLALIPLRRERDEIVNRLSAQEGNSLSHAVQAMQRQSFNTNAQRAADVAAFRKATGGVNISAFASVADQRKAQRRGLRRRGA